MEMQSLPSDTYIFRVYCIKGGERPGQVGAQKTYVSVHRELYLGNALHAHESVHIARDPTPCPKAGRGIAHSLLLSLEPTELPGLLEPTPQMGPLPNKATRAQRALPLKGLH